MDRDKWDNLEARELERVDREYEKHRSDGTWLGGLLPIVDGPEKNVEVDYYRWDLYMWESENA